MGIVDLHFHDSEFTAVKRPGRTSESGESSETGRSGGCTLCKLLPVLLVLGALAVVAFLAKRKLGGGSETTTLSEFEDESEGEETGTA